MYRLHQILIEYKMEIPTSQPKVLASQLIRCKISLLQNVEEQADNTYDIKKRNYLGHYHV